MCTPTLSLGFSFCEGSRELGEGGWDKARQDEEFLKGWKMIKKHAIHMHVHLTNKI